MSKSPSLVDRVAALPLPIRHAALVLLAGGLSWLGTTAVPWLQDWDSAGLGAVLALALTGALAAVTPLVQGYGLGTREPARPAPQGEAPLYELQYLPQVEIDRLRSRLLDEIDRRRGGQL